MDYFTAQELVEGLAYSVIILVVGIGAAIGLWVCLDDIIGD